VEEEDDPFEKSSEVGAKIVLKTKGEMDIDDLPPIETLTIQANVDDLVHFGRVINIMDRLVSIISFKGMPPLELDSVLFLKDGSPLGSIFEVFGPVVEPRYLVRFNTGEEINNRQITVDMPVYYAASFDAPTTAFVFMEHLRKLKGSDASWKHNNEPPAELKEYSDDEEERRDKLKSKAKRKGNNHGTPSPRSLSGYASPSSLIAPPNTPANSYHENKFNEHYHRNNSGTNWFSNPRGRRKK
jgi:H/ACA ribonucleoprotein complex non-core subunit NAF1